MLAVEAGRLVRHEGREPQPRAKARVVDRLGRLLHAGGEFLRVGLEPVAHVGLPAVVDLEEVARLQPTDAALQILPDRLGADVLVAVIPARVAGDLLLCARLDAHRVKPRVKDLVLGPVGEVEVEGVEGSAAAQSRAVALDAQLVAVAVVAQHGVARVLVERADEAEIVPLAEVAVALAVGDAFPLRIADPVVVAVAVEPVVVDGKLRQMADAVRAADARVLRAVGPTLVAVHEDAARRAERHVQRSLDLDDRILRQVLDDVQRPVRAHTLTEDGRVIFQRDLVMENVRHIRSLT